MEAFCVLGYSFGIRDGGRVSIEPIVNALFNEKKSISVHGLGRIFQDLDRIANASHGCIDIDAQRIGPRTGKPGISTFCSIAGTTFTQYAGRK